MELLSPHDSGAWRQRCLAWARRRRLRPQRGAGRRQPPPAAEHSLPALSAPRLLLKSGAGVARRQRRQRPCKQRGISSVEPGGRKAGSLRVVSPLLSCPGICLKGLCLVPLHREATSRLKDAGSARLPGPPFGRPLRCGQTSLNPEGALSRVKHELKPRNSF